MRITITGGQGDIAQIIAGHLISNGHLISTPGQNELDVTNYVMIRNFMIEEMPDTLINCAGFISPENIEWSNQYTWKKHIDINLIGTYLCAKYALENGCKTIINIASTSGLKGREGWSAYCASKAGVISLTQSLAEEGIKAYCVSPGRTQSKMRKNLFPNEDQTKLLNPNAIGELVADIIGGHYANGSHIVISKKDGIKIQD